MKPNLNPHRAMRLTLLFTKYRLPRLKRAALLCFGVLTMIQATPITVFTAEIGTSRRIIISLGDTQPSAPDWIHFSSDSATGRFVLTLKPLINPVYQGRNRILERGVVPVQLTISNPDSASFRITGKTIPFKKVWSFWVVQDNEFILDFFQETPPETIFHEKSLTPGSPQAMFSVKNRPTTSFIAPKTEKHMASLFKRALLYATLILVFGLALILSLKRDPARKPDPDSQEEIKSTAKPNRSNPEADKDAIRKIMKSTGQSWDEAELSLSLGKAKDYGRV
ncbi:MAG: hypothetical protein ACE5D1_07630 [Fidelibacterota bacterium]